MLFVRVCGLVCAVLGVAFVVVVVVVVVVDAVAADSVLLHLLVVCLFVWSFVSASWLLFLSFFHVALIVEHINKPLFVVVGCWFNCYNNNQKLLFVALLVEHLFVSRLLLVTMTVVTRMVIIVVFCTKPTIMPNCWLRKTPTNEKLSP